MKGISEDFCREKECIIQPTKVRIAFVENPSSLILKQRQIVESYCTRQCPYTRLDFLEWLKAKEPSYLAKKLFDIV
jgi:hypothetical protein